MQEDNKTIFGENDNYHFHDILAFFVEELHSPVFSLPNWFLFQEINLDDKCRCASQLAVIDKGSF